MMQLNETVICNREYCFLENSIAKESYAYLFTSPIDEVIVYKTGQMTTLFERIAENQKNGFFAVGYFSYECEISKYNVKNSTSLGPLAHFVFYKCKTRLNDLEMKAVFSAIRQYENDADSIIYDLSFNMSYKDYEAAFNRIQHHLLNGDSYQVNYTGQYGFKLQGSFFTLYEKLRTQQLVSYGAYLPFSSGHVLSFSPELFFTKSGSNIKTKPMKGTVHRYLDKEKDELQKQFLKKDIKNQSENLIIVDLIRNDLSRIAETGSVKVNRLFDIETYKSVHQMTSEIQAKIDVNLPLEEIFRALFPCGSITGAPKKRTMEIINETEHAPRGIYTGCIGYISPENDMSFNVAIRTIRFDQNNVGVLGVGGGITTRSICADEWQEMHLKGQFFHKAPKSFSLVETLLFYNDYVFFEEHIQRLSKSCEYFGFVFNRDMVCEALRDLIRTFDPNIKYKVRLLYDYLGSLELTYDLIDNSDDISKFSIGFSRRSVDSKNILFQHKTTANNVRGLYNKEYDLAVKNGFHDVLFHNENGYLTETSRYNIIFRIKNTLYTPPVSDGLLPGIYRQYLISQKNVIEKSISISEITLADEILLCNSVRGMLPVNLVSEN